MRGGAAGRRCLMGAGLMSLGLMSRGLVRYEPVNGVRRHASCRFWRIATPV